VGATLNVPGTDHEFLEQTVQMVEEMTRASQTAASSTPMSPTDDGYRVTEAWKSEKARQRFRCSVFGAGRR
jgi:hypothetical protein